MLKKTFSSIKYWKWPELSLFFNLSDHLKWQTWKEGKNFFCKKRRSMLPQSELSNCDICVKRKIIFMREMKRYKILLWLKGWVQKLFELYRQIPIRVLTNVGFSFNHFACTKLSNMNLRVNRCWKKPFFINHIDWGIIFNKIHKSI